MSMGLLWKNVPGKVESCPHISPSPLDKHPLLCYTVSEQTRGAVWLRRKCRTLQPDPDNAGVGSMFVGYLITIR